MGSGGMEDTKLAKTAEKRKAWADQAAAMASAAFAYEMCTMNAFATGVNINSNYQIKSDIGNVNPEGLILGLAFWIARLVGIGMLVWGIYGYVTARKDGEAESMNGALGKLISGLVLICMPSVMTGLGII